MPTAQPQKASSDKLALFILSICGAFVFLRVIEQMFGWILLVYFFFLGACFFVGKMAPLMTTTSLVIKCRCCCDRCKDKFKKLRKDIPQIPVEFDTEQNMANISVAVDPALVREKIKEHGIRILREESSPINNHHHHQQKHLVSPKPSVPEIHKQVQGVPPDVTEIAATRIQEEPIVKKTPGYCCSDHEHELAEVKGFNKRFPCNGCKEDGFGSRYRCEPCNFDLHPGCSSPERTISPEIPKIRQKLVFQFHPQNTPNKELFCVACGKGIHGCFYKFEAKSKSKSKSLNLHPRCARLKAQVRNGGKVMDLREEVSSACLWCRNKVPPDTKKGIPGWCYVSKCERYNVHIYCITQMLHEAWQKGLMDNSGESSIETIDLQRMPVSKRNRRGRSTEALKIISILRMIVGVLLGDPTAVMASLLAELLQQLL